MKVFSVLSASLALDQTFEVSGGSRAVLSSTCSSTKVSSTPLSAKKPFSWFYKVQGISVEHVICALPFILAGVLKARFPDGENVNLVLSSCPTSSSGW